MTWLHLFLLGAAAWRVGRFIILDSLIDEPRDKFFFWLNERGNIFADKLYDLLSCPWCLTVWTAAGATGFYSAVHGWPGWDFLPIWAGVIAVAMLLWTYMDSD